MKGTIQRWSHTKSKSAHDGRMEPTHQNIQALALERDLLRGIVEQIALDDGHWIEWGGERFYRVTLEGELWLTPEQRAKVKP